MLFTEARTARVPTSTYRSARSPMACRSTPVSSRASARAVLVEEAQQQDREGDDQRVPEGELSERLRRAEQRAWVGVLRQQPQRTGEDELLLPAHGQPRTEHRRVGQPRGQLEALAVRGGQAVQQTHALRSSNAKQANTMGASTNTVIATVKIIAPLLWPTLRGSRARKARYRGQLAIAVTPAASKAWMKPCTIQKARTTIAAARSRPA